MVHSDQLQDGMFTSTIVTAPETWSTCINDTLKVPAINIRTTLKLSGEQLDDAGAMSVAVVGSSDVKDTKKALIVSFEEAWRPCP